LFNRIFFAAVFLVWLEFSFAASYHPVSAVIVVNADDGEVICSYNADTKTQPASLTKMMTLLLAFKALYQKKISLSAKIPVSVRAASQKPSSLRLKMGESISVRDAILALVIKSANDVAVALAEYIGKTEKSFVCMMNREAKRLGMTSTKFFNASGWKDPQQMTTARDMATLARALLQKYPGYYHYFSQKQFLFQGKCIKGHYMLLGKTESIDINGMKRSISIDGIKTGFVNASGYNVAASAVNGNSRLIAVVLGGKTSKARDALAQVLLRKGFLKLASRKNIKNKKPAGAPLPSEPQKCAQALAKSSLQVHGIYNRINESS
jgi:D-alanyl-D-alanine carboxypeptidase